MAKEIYQEISNLQNISRDRTGTAGPSHLKICEATAFPDINTSVSEKLGTVIKHVIPVPGRLRQEVYHEFKSSLSYRVH